MKKCALTSVAIWNIYNFHLIHFIYSKMKGDSHTSATNYTTTSHATMSGINHRCHYAGQKSQYFSRDAAPGIHKE